MEVACEDCTDAAPLALRAGPRRRPAAQRVMSTLATTRYSTSTTAQRATRRRLTGRMTARQSEQVRAPAGAGNPQCGQVTEEEARMAMTKWRTAAMER